VGERLATRALQLGCGGATTATVDPALSRVSLATALYKKAAREFGRPPKDEQEFKQAIAAAGMDAAVLKLTSIDEAVVSERDGQPLVIAYGGPPAGSDVVVYEQTGVDGKRLIGHRIGQVEEVDEARFRELVPKK
jgi:hypothetical protein